LAQILRRYAEMATAAARPAARWRDRFDNALAAAIADAAPALPAVARRLAISPRTLQRRLRQHDTTWQQELDAARHRQATQMLSATDLPMRTIAARLGYADTRSLRRAIHRWTDTSDHHANAIPDR
jgi:AraC-like DNA-binding protein